MSFYKKIIFSLAIGIIIGSIFSLPVFAQSYKSYCWPQSECKKPNQWERTDEAKKECMEGYGYCYAEQGKVNLQVKIPGVEKTGSLGDYIPAIYNYMVSIVSIFAIIMIMVGGLQYLTSGGSPEKVGKAKERILGAVIGIILVLGSYTLLQTINPALTKLKIPQLKMVAPESVTMWCPNDAKYECGKKYTKDDDPALKVGDGFCWGQYCASQDKVVSACSKTTYESDEPPECIHEKAAAACRYLKELGTKCLYDKILDDKIFTPCTNGESLDIWSNKLEKLGLEWKNSRVTETSTKAWIDFSGAIIDEESGGDATRYRIFPCTSEGYWPYESCVGANMDFIDGICGGLNDVRADSKIWEIFPKE